MNKPVLIPANIEFAIEEYAALRKLGTTVEAWLKERPGYSLLDVKEAVQAWKQSKRKKRAH